MREPVKKQYNHSPQMADRQEVWFSFLNSLSLMVFFCIQSNIQQIISILRLFDSIILKIMEKEKRTNSAYVRFVGKKSKIQL